MRLHQDPSAFETLLLNRAEHSGIRADILEKDYFVTLLLKELSQKQVKIPAFFKGGTALYKAIGGVRRFSEDIDITVYVDDCPSKSQAQKRLEAVTKKYQCLPISKADPGNITQEGSITTIYHYESVVTVDDADSLQRFRRVKVEATSFTISEPHAPIQIAPLLYELALENQKAVLNDTYEVSPFAIETITLERIFIDKVFASEFYYLEDQFFDTAKHLYDIVVLLNMNLIQTFLQKRDSVEKIIALKRIEEQSRTGSRLAAIKIGQFTVFKSALANEDLMREFVRMQKTYVFSNEYLIDQKQLIAGISLINGYFNDL